MHYDNELYNKGLNKIHLINIQDFELYQNNYATNLRELSSIN